MPVSSFADYVHSLGPIPTGFMVIVGMLFLGLVLGMRYGYRGKQNDM